MFSSPGLYLGIVPVEDGLYNLAGLVQLSVAQRAASLDDLLVSFRRSHPALETYMTEAVPQFVEWMQTRIPRFGLKNIMLLPRTYYIGDAILTVPPACGNGLSLAIHSGCSAAHYAMQDDPIGFHRFWRSHVKRQLFFDQLLHHLLLHPSCGDLFCRAIRRFPSLAQRFYHLTRTSC
jgi:flavin-dependent dehydrogenase